MIRAPEIVRPKFLRSLKGLVKSCYAHDVMMLCECSSLDLVRDGKDKQILSTKPARKSRLVVNTNKSHKSHNFWLKACMVSGQVSFPRVFLWIRRFQQRVLQVFQNCQPF